VSPQRIARTIRRDVPLLRDDQRLSEAVTQIIDADLPALPVVAADGSLLGIFGEREFIAALFPGYLTTLGYAGFIPRSLDEALGKRASCVDDRVDEHMNTDHIDVDTNVSDIQLAEIFLHHRVLIIPIVDDGRVVAIITREDFFRELAQRLSG
jgi:CBS domain-containing protein